ILGGLFGAFGSVCGRHLRNLLLFRYLNRHPDELSGQVRMSMTLVLKTSQFDCIGLILLFIIVVALAPCGYTAGLLLGIVAMVFAHWVWAYKARSVKAEPNQAILTEPP